MLKILKKIKEKSKEIILGMDLNLDLLKSSSHHETQQFLDINFDNNILPCITQPTRIIKSTATLTDNIFISQNLHKSFDSLIIVNDISDHLPSIVNIHKQSTSTDEPLEFKCRSLNECNMAEINNKFLTSDWAVLDNKDVNIALTQLQERIDSCMSEVAPLKVIRIPNHKIW